MPGLDAPAVDCNGGEVLGMIDGSVRFFAERSDQNVMLDMVSGSGDTQ